MCTSESACKGASGVAPAFGAPASETTSGAGNLTPQTMVLGAKTTTPPKKPTRAQLLAKALKSCKKLKQKNRRVACEKSARKRYAAKKASKSAKRPSHAASNAARAKR